MFVKLRTISGYFLYDFAIVAGARLNLLYALYLVSSPENNVAEDTNLSSAGRIG